MAAIARDHTTSTAAAVAGVMNLAKGVAPSSPSTRRQGPGFTGVSTHSGISKVGNITSKSSPLMSVDPSLTPSLRRKRPLSIIKESSADNDSDVPVEAAEKAESTQGNRSSREGSGTTHSNGRPVLNHSPRTSGAAVGAKPASASSTTSVSKGSSTSVTATTRSSTVRHLANRFERSSTSSPSRSSPRSTKSTTNSTSNSATNNTTKPNRISSADTSKQSNSSGSVTNSKTKSSSPRDIPTPSNTTKHVSTLIMKTNRSRPSTPTNSPPSSVSKSSAANISPRCSSPLAHTKQTPKTGIRKTPLANTGAENKSNIHRASSFNKFDSSNSSTKSPRDRCLARSSSFKVTKATQEGSKIKTTKSAAKCINESAEKNVSANANEKSNEGTSNNRSCEFNTITPSPRLSLPDVDKETSHDGCHQASSKTLNSNINEPPSISDITTKSITPSGVTQTGSNNGLSDTKHSDIQTDGVKHPAPISTDQQSGIERASISSDEVDNSRSIPQITITASVGLTGIYHKPPPVLGPTEQLPLDAGDVGSDNINLMPNNIQTHQTYKINGLSNINMVNQQDTFMLTNENVTQKNVDNRYTDSGNVNNTNETTTGTRSPLLGSLSPKLGIRNLLTQNMNQNSQLLPTNMHLNNNINHYNGIPRNNYLSFQKGSTTPTASSILSYYKLINSSFFNRRISSGGSSICEEDEDAENEEASNDADNINTSSKSRRGGLIQREATTPTPPPLSPLPLLSERGSSVSSIGSGSGTDPSSPSPTPSTSAEIPTPPQQPSTPTHSANLPFATYAAITPPDGQFSASDFSRLKETTEKLRLTTRRPSTMAWRQKYMDTSRRPSAGYGLPNGGSLAMDGGYATDGKLTQDRKERIDAALSWLREELQEMRVQDQSLARQLLSIRQDIHQLKLQRSTEAHQDLIDYSWNELEEQQEFSDVLDLPQPVCGGDNPLRHVGVTRLNLCARRFSAC